MSNFIRAHDNIREAHLRHAFWFVYDAWTTRKNGVVAGESLSASAMWKVVLEHAASQRQAADAP